MSVVLSEKTHIFYSPNKIIFGPGTIKALGNEVLQFGVQKAFIVTDPGVVRANLLLPVKESLESTKISYSIYDRVEPEPSARIVDEATKMFKSERCDIVIGLGGGSSLDVAKGISVMATNEGSVLDMCGFDLIKERGMPKILAPTTAGTGSEITRAFVVTDEKENTKKVVYSSYVISDVAIVDPLLTISMPPNVTADTGMDALVHAIETFVSMNATPFSDILAEKSIQWIAKYLPIAWAKGSNQEARYFMSLASTVTGMAFASGGLGAVHALSYPLGTEYHMSHGRSNAVMLPHVMRYNLCGNPERYAQIAGLMGKELEGASLVQMAQRSVEAVKELLETIQLPFHLRDYRIPETDLPKLVKGGLKASRLFIPNPRDLREEDVRWIYREAY